jgi:DNA-binding GntR family transcriptional regulator
MSETALQLDGPARGVTALRDRLRAAIVTGEIPAGAVRTQAQLAQALGVSRTPLREALRMLELEHLIVRQSNGRFRVADITLSDIEELGVMRIALDAAAARLTVPALTNADHAELEGLFAQTSRLARLGEWEAFHRPHVRFHLKLTSGVGPMYTDQLVRLWDHAERYRMAYTEIVTAQGREGVAIAEHRAILDAAEAYDADGVARGLAVQYARRAIEIGAVVDPSYPMDRIRTILELETGSRKLPAT